jgi:hypothetical protein
LAVAAHDNNIIAGNNGDSANFWGWGVNGALTFNLPMIGAGDTFTVQGAYSHGALAYGGATAPGTLNIFGNGTLFQATDWYDEAAGVTSIPTSWSVASHAVFKLTPQFSLSPEISYAQISYSGAPLEISKKITSWMGGVVAHWDPVTNLDFQLDLMYASSKVSTPVNWISPPAFHTNASGFFGRIAIARTF